MLCKEATCTQLYYRTFIAKNDLNKWATPNSLFYLGIN